MRNAELLLVLHRWICNYPLKIAWMRRCHSDEVHPEDENKLSSLSLASRLSALCNWLSPVTIPSHMKGELKISCIGILYTWGSHPHFSLPETTTITDQPSKSPWVGHIL